MRRLLALLLVCAMVLGLTPSAFATEVESEPTPLTQEDYETADLIWEAVYAKETEMRSKRAPLYNTIEALITEVTSSPYYAEGTLIRNGEHFFWETTDGIPCGYSPRLAELGRNAAPMTGYDASIAENTVLTASYETKGGTPGSREVFLLQPYYGIDASFTDQYWNEANSIAAALGGTATVYRTTSATIDAIADSIEAGGVVIFDSHGDTDFANGDDYTSRANSSYICLQTSEGLTAEDYELATGEFGDYYHAFYGGSYGTMRYYCVDGTAIANHMENKAADSMLWMALCLSMATDGLHAPLLNEGVEVAYGYSQSVTFDYDYMWEEIFWEEMLLGKTVAEAIDRMKTEVGQWDWCHASGYDTIAAAKAMYSAFPIVVSDQDIYPGHGNVDDLQMVRSVWTLLSPCDHGNIRFIPHKPATCTEDGNIAYYLCIECNAVFRDEALTDRITLNATNLEATGHSYDSGKVTTSPTCLTDGILTYTCGTCNHSYTELLPAEGHNYVDGFCSLCGKEKPNVVDFELGSGGVFVLAAKVNGKYYAMPNNYTEKSGKLSGVEINVSQGFVDEVSASNIAVELTYVPQTGKYTIYNGTYYLRYPSSTNIGGISTPYYWTIEPGVNGTWKITSQTSSRGLIYRAAGYNSFGGYYRPSVTSGGREYFDLEIIPVAMTTPGTSGCTHVNTVQIQTPPTCTQDGTLTLRCEDCGETLNTQTLLATGHTWHPGEVVVSPGCENPGSQSYSCQFCTETKTETLPPAGHSWDESTVTTEPTCAAPGIKTFTCTRCSQVRTEDLPEKEHNWDGGVLTAEPNCSVPGGMTYTCILCSAIKTESVATTAHSFQNGFCIHCGSGYAPEENPFRIGMSGTFVLAANVNGTYYAMSNDFPESGKVTSRIITPVNGYVLQADTEGIDIVMEYDELTSTYGIYNGTGYLGYNSSTNLSTWESFYGWTLSDGVNGTWRFQSHTESRGLMFRHGTYQQFGAYAAANAYNISEEYFDLEILPVYTYIPGEDIPEWIPPVDGSIVINHSLNLASDISINYAVLTSLLDGYDSFELHCKIPVYENCEYAGYETLILEPVLNEYFYYFTLTGITAVQMGDQIEATLYMTKGENTYCSETDVYSVADYAYGQMKKEGNPQSLKKLCAELLRYGSYAQIFKDYRSDSLVNEIMTEEQMAYLSDLEAVTFNPNNRVLDDLADPSVTWAGKTLNLESKVVLKFVVNLSHYEGDPQDLTLKISYTNYKGEVVEKVLPAPELYMPELNYYAFDLDTLLAAELRTLVSAAVYCGETQLSPTVEYSPDAYAIGKTGTLLTLCKALMSYSDTALAYFTQQ